MHRHEIAFVWMAFVFVFVIASDMATPHNSNYIAFADKPLPYLAERFWEVLIVPLCLLHYLNAAHVLQAWWSKSLAALFCYGVLFGLERLAVSFRLLTYLDWKPWWSLIVWIAALVLAVALQRGMRWLLRKEGKVA